MTLDPGPRTRDTEVSANTIVLYAPDAASVARIGCSPPSWMVELALLEKGVEFEPRRLSFAAGEHKTPAMLALNPRGTIPVLVDGPLVLTEALAMLEYVEELDPARPLLPAERVARAQARECLWRAGELKRVGMLLLAAMMRATDEELATDGLAPLKAPVRQQLAWVDEALGATAYLAGDALTLADLVVFVYVAAFRHLGWPLDLETPHIDAWFGRLRTRPSVVLSWPSTFDL